VTTTTAAQQVTILMVEDDEGHARLIERNIRRAGVCNQIVHKLDGTTAIAHLEAEVGRSGQPVLVLLDLNLPDMSGLAILERMKADPQMKRIPVIVLTTTDDAREIQRCYDLGLFLSVIQVPEPPK
jgi:CheY-like chemotaxis protein